MFKCPFNGVLQKSPWSDDCMNVNRALQIQLDDPSFKALRALSTYTNPRPNAPPWAKPTVWDWTNRQMAFYRLRQDKQRECLWTQHFSFVWWESLLCCRGQFFFFFSPGPEWVFYAVHEKSFGYGHSAWVHGLQIRHVNEQSSTSSTLQ